VKEGGKKERSEDNSDRLRGFVLRGQKGRGKAVNVPTEREKEAKSSVKKR